MSITLAAAFSAGAIGARPAAGVDGRIYFATDTFRLYRDNGSIWTDITPSSYSAPPVVLPAPSGAASYALPAAPLFPASSFYFYNGQKMKYGVFYSITAATLNLLTSELPQTGETHELYAS